MRICPRRSMVLALTLLLGLCSASSFATVLALMSVRGGIGNPVNYQSSTAAPNNLSLLGSIATLQFRGNADCIGLACQIDGPALGAYLTSNGPFDMADSAIRYDINVLGAPAQVPILVSGRYQIINPDEFPINAGGTDAAAAISVSDLNVELFSFQSVCYNYPPEFNEEPPEKNCGSGIFRGTFNALAGSALTVAMRAIAFRRFIDAAPAPASAFLDPYFQIDPAWAATHPGYSLSFDPGVANGPLPGDATAVPEPAPIVLMLLAFFAFAPRYRRRF